MALHPDTVARRMEEHPALQELKRRARDMKRASSACYSHCLEALAQAEGYKSYYALRAALKDGRWPKTKT